MDDYIEFTRDNVGCIAVVIFIAVMMLIIAVVFFPFRQDVNGRVESFSWMRSIDIQTWKTVEESGWDIPTSGRFIRSYQAYHHSDRVQTGIMCSGNPTVCHPVYTSRSVYRERFDYEIDRWITTHKIIRQADDHKPEWPDVSDIKAQNGQFPQLGDERESTRTSRYTIRIKSEGNIYSLDITDTKWLSFDYEQRCIIVFNILGQALDVKQ